MPVSCVQFCVHLILSDYKSVNFKVHPIVGEAAGSGGSVRSEIDHR